MGLGRTGEWQGGKMLPQTIGGPGGAMGLVIHIAVSEGGRSACRSVLSGC
jgi:hypothetical protein